MPRCPLTEVLISEDRSPREMASLAALIELFAALPAPPDPFGLYPRYGECLDIFLAALEGTDGEVLEEAFLTLYSHLHGHEAPYTPDERRQMDDAGGYWNHAGGLSPILKAGDHIRPQSVVADFGAGNGLQCLLMQKLYPHRKTIQIEISSQAIVAGQQLQGWLGIEKERVEWRAMDVLDASTSGMNFIYLYRPVRPDGPGRGFYERFAGDLEASPQEVVIFSIADCLRGFLTERFQVFYSDGQLTCYRG